MEIILGISLIETTRSHDIAIALTRQFGSLGVAYTAWRNKSFFSLVCQHAWQSDRLDDIKQQYAQFDGVVIHYRDKRYPRDLIDLANPPFLLFCRGNAALLNASLISCVGSRDHSEYSGDVLRSLMPAFITKRLTVVSGLARGVDTLAHENTLASGLATVAVIAGGVDNHSTLLGERIVRGGLLVSEDPLGFRPTKASFVLRNRLIAALSPLLVLVESHGSPGSLHTLRFAQQLGRAIVTFDRAKSDPFYKGVSQVQSIGGHVLAQPHHIRALLDRYYG